MRIPVLVQNTRTRKYLKKDGRWTIRGSEAAVFLSTRTAIEFCLQKELTEVELVCRFRNLKRDVSIPLALQGVTEKSSTGK